MARHSRHSNDRSFFTHKERVDAGYAGHRKEVMGTDCFLPFGHCALSLKAPKDAVVTPDGWIYEREYILEYLLTQKLELQAQAKKFEEQEARKARKEDASKHEAQQKELDEFRRQDQALLSEDYSHKRALERSAEAAARSLILDDRPEKRLRKGELLNIDKAKQRENCFWAKETTQTAAPTELKKVDTTVRCPMSGKKLRAKDLISVKFEVTDKKMMDHGGDRGVFCCAVSKHPITHQQAYLIKPSGQVVLESVLKDCVYKEMICPITGKPLKSKDDVLKLQMGGTGFAAHNAIEAKSWSHIRSFAGDNRTQHGHLPRAGYVGLK